MTVAACGFPTWAHQDSDFGGRYMSCDRDPPDEIRGLSLTSVDPENTRLCLIASPGDGFTPQAFGSTSEVDNRCSTLPSRHPFRVRSGMGITQGIVHSYDVQRSNAERPNQRNFSFLSFAQVKGKSGECELAPWLTARVPYLVMEGDDGKLLTVLVYIPETTEQYLDGFGLDLDVDMEATAIAFSALMGEEAPD